MKITLPLKKMNGELIEEKTIEFRSLRVGAVKRLFRVIDVDRMMKECHVIKDVTSYLMGRCMGMSDYVQQLITELFSITDEQYEDNVELSDLAVVLSILITESLNSLQKTEDGLKNLLRAE